MVKCENRNKDKTVPVIQLHSNDERDVKFHTLSHPLNTVVKDPLCLLYRIGWAPEPLSIHW